MWPTTVDTNKPGAGMIAGGLAIGDFAVSLRVSHPGFNLVQNLLFAEPGIFEASDLRSANGCLPLQAPLQDKLDEVIGETDEVESNSITADRIELIRASDVQNLRFGIAGAGEIGGRIAAREWMLPLMRGGNKSHASIVAEPGLLDLDQLCDFGIGGIQRFELFEAAGPHAGLIERAVVRQNMLLATASEKDTYTEKQG